MIFFTTANSHGVIEIICRNKLLKIILTVQNWNKMKSLYSVKLEQNEISFRINGPLIPGTENV